MGGVRVPSRNKFGNRKTVVDGITFASAREAARWSDLRLLERAGKITELQRQVRFQLVVNGVKIGSYTADAVYHENGVRIIEDSKGYRTRDYILRAKLMRALHGEVREV